MSLLYSVRRPVHSSREIALRPVEHRHFGTGEKSSRFLSANHLRGSTSFQIEAPEELNRKSSKMLRETVSGATLVARFQLDPELAALAQDENGLIIRWTFTALDLKKGEWGFALSS